MKWLLRGGGVAVRDQQLLSGAYKIYNNTSPHNTILEIVLIDCEKFAKN